MLFLMNDTILSLDAHGSIPPIAPLRFRSLGLEFVMRLGAEMFAESPLLHHQEPERARRLALLIRSKRPEVNAALFVAPAVACPPVEVTHRLAAISMEAMAALYTRAREGMLDTVAADREVWRRLAA